MRDDVKNEQAQPPWPFTCYAHQRDKANDMVGDFQYEEVSILQSSHSPPRDLIFNVLRDVLAFMESGAASRDICCQGCETDGVCARS